MLGISSPSIRAKIVGLILLLFVSLSSVFFYFFGDFITAIEQDLGEKIIRQQVSVTKQRALGYFTNDQSLIETGLINNHYQNWMRDPSNKGYEAEAINSIEVTCQIISCQGWFLYSHKTLEGFDWQIDTPEIVSASIDLDRDKWYTDIIATGKPYFIDASIHPFTHIPYVYFDYFIREEGQLLGLVGTYVGTSNTITDILNHPSEDVSNILLDNNRITRAIHTEHQDNLHSELVSNIQNKPWSSLVDERTNDLLDRLQESPEGRDAVITTQLRLNNRDYLAALMFIEELEWYALSLLDKEIMSSKINTLPLISISVMTLIALILITIYVLNSQLFKPILTIHDVVRKIAQGQYHEKVKTVKEDELGALAAGINQMTEELANNLSRIKKQNDALNQAIAEANKATQAKSFFLSNMSHELRTPMNAVLGFTQIGMDAKGAQEKNDYLDKIHQAGEHLLRIINDILDFNKIESDEFSLENTSFRINEVIRKALHICHLRAQEKGLALKIELDKSIPAHLIGDPFRVEQILINLVSNAIKFTDKGQISIHVNMLEKLNGQLVLDISVTDTGIGMNREQLSRLFKVFTQADESITRKYGGTGLGLAISKQLVELMGGKIEVSSQVGIGSTFKFNLRLAYSEEPIKEAIKTNKIDLKTIQESTQNLRALLVEDNHINQVVAEKLLEPLGMQLDIAEDGLIAVEKAQNKQYELILMDIQMPNLDGIGATREIRKFNQNVVIIGLSAHANAADVEKAKRIGMSDYITKPINQETLFAIIFKYFS